MPRVSIRRRTITIRTIQSPHPCLSCESAEAVITGLCHPCYYHFRYVHIRLQRLEISQPKKKSNEQDDMIRYCPDCKSPLHHDGRIRASSNNYRKREYRDVLKCRKCGYATTISP